MGSCDAPATDEGHGRGVMFRASRFGCSEPLTRECRLKLLSGIQAVVERCGLATCTGIVLVCDAVPTKRTNPEMLR